MRTITIIITMLLCIGPLPSAETKDAAKAQNSLRAALDFVLPLDNQGGYYAGFSPDGKKFWGEWNPVKRDVVTIQPPGTCTVGSVLLDAYLVLEDKTCLDAARKSADFLIRAQQPNGGWYYETWITDDGLIPCQQGAPTGPPNTTTNRGVLEDGCIRGQMEFLLKMSEVTGDPKYFNSARKGADFLITAQYPDGGWPQHYPPPRRGYSGYYTLNDGVFEDTIQLLLDFHARTGEQKYLEAAMRGGDWLIANQLPEPATGWAQQYDPMLKPAWARQWEPPSACSRVTAGAVKMLLALHLVTGDDKYLGPIPAAIAWLKRSQVIPGQWARFYDPQTSRPIYARGYRISYSPEIIGWNLTGSYQGEFGCKTVMDTWGKFLDSGPDALSDSGGLTVEELAERVGRIISDQNSDGLWLTGEWMYTRDWASNCRLLLDYISINQNPAP
ncbi:pectate lyase [candidate division KSB1 bacterium]